MYFCFPVFNESTDVQQEQFLVLFVTSDEDDRLVLICISRTYFLPLVTKSWLAFTVKNNWIENHL